MMVAVSVNNLDDFDQAVLFTLSYSDLFDFPLMASEIEERLPVVWDFAFLTGRKKTSAAKKLIKNSAKIKKSLKKLIEKDFISEKKDKWQSFYCLQGREAVVKKRLDKTKFLAEKEASMAEFLEIARKIPFIRAVFLTGSTAVDNASQSDDLDFLIITADKTLWLSRFLLILIAKLKGKRPSLDSAKSDNLDRSNAWCLNMWLTVDNLKLEQKRLSIYQTYELLQMRPLLDENNLIVRFYQANRNLAKFVAFPQLKKPIPWPREKQNYLIIVFNYFFYYLQVFYRRLFFENNNFVLELGAAYFNNSKRSDEFFAKIKEHLP